MHRLHTDWRASCFVQRLCPAPRPSRPCVWEVRGALHDGMHKTLRQQPRLDMRIPQSSTRKKRGKPIQKAWYLCCANIYIYTYVLCMFEHFNVWFLFNLSISLPKSTSITTPHNPPFNQSTWWLRCRWKCLAATSCSSPRLYRAYRAVHYSHRSGNGTNWTLCYGKSAVQTCFNIGDSSIFSIAIYARP